MGTDITKRTIMLGRHEVPYELRLSSRARTMRIEVLAGGRILAVLPQRMSERALERFMLQRGTWLLRAVRDMEKKRTHTVTENPFSYHRYKERARKHIRQKVEYFNRFYEYDYGRIAIRNQKTCWGSCSNKGNLNFSYKLLFLPAHLCDYVVVHELCHLEELNHSKRFWKLVERAIPDYKSRIQQLNRIR